MTTLDSDYTQRDARSGLSQPSSKLCMVPPQLRAIIKLSVVSIVIHSQIEILCFLTAKGGLNELNFVFGVGTNLASQKVIAVQAGVRRALTVALRGPVVIQ